MLMGVRIKQWCLAWWFEALDYVGLYKYFKDLDSVLSSREKHLRYHLLRGNPLMPRKR